MSMADGFLVLVCVLLLSGISGLFGLCCALARRLTWLESLPRNQATHPEQWIAPPKAPGTYVLSDRELAAKERQLLASSRQRAGIADADARRSLTRMFRPG